MPSNIQEMLANELTDTQVLIVLIPLALVMLFVGWVEKRAGRPDYKKLENGHKGWALVQMLPPQSCALMMSALPEADMQAYISAGCTAPAKLLSVADKLLDEFMASWPKERRISKSSSLKEKEAAWGSFAASDTNEAAQLILKLWPPEHAAAEAMAENAPAAAETAEDATADTVPETVLAEDIAAAVPHTDSEDSEHSPADDAGAEAAPVLETAIHAEELPAVQESANTADISDATPDHETAGILPS